MLQNTTKDEAVDLVLKAAVTLKEKLQLTEPYVRAGPLLPLSPFQFNPPKATLSWKRKHAGRMGCPDLFYFAAAIPSLLLYP